MDSWPSYRQSAIRQWRGLTDEERAFYQAIVARRTRYDLGGCINGNGTVYAQRVEPIWSAVTPIGERLDLIAAKEDL